MNLKQVTTETIGHLSVFYFGVGSNGLVGRWVLTPEASHRTPSSVEGDRLGSAFVSVVVPSSSALSLYKHLWVNPLV